MCYLLRMIISTPLSVLLFTNNVQLITKCSLCLISLGFVGGESGPASDIDMFTFILWYESPCKDFTVFKQANNLLLLLL